MFVKISPSHLLLGRGLSVLRAYLEESDLSRLLLSRRDVPDLGYRGRNFMREPVKTNDELSSVSAVQTRTRRSRGTGHITTESYILK